MSWYNRRSATIALPLAGGELSHPVAPEDGSSGQLRLDPHPGVLDDQVVGHRLIRPASGMCGKSVALGIQPPYGGSDWPTWR